MFQDEEIFEKSSLWKGWDEAKCSAGRKLQARDLNEFWCLKC